MSSDDIGYDPRRILIRVTGPVQMWLWRAWSVNRARICDCGTAVADNESDARRIARATLGGPYRSEVTEFEIVRIGMVTP